MSSTSPQRSRTSSPSLPSEAEIRSQAVARLKRAASLPRTPKSQRTTQPYEAPRAAAAESVEYAQHSPDIHMHYGEEEILSMAPIPHSLTGAGMQRSLSASSSFHMPSPPHISFASPFYSAASSPLAGSPPSWAAKHLAESYCSSLNLTPPSAGQFPIGFTPPLGRNTPSPLPSLGALRSLSRSNSAAARAEAMSKLTGGKESHISIPTYDKSLLNRGDVGSFPHHFGTTDAPGTPELPTPQVKDIRADHQIQDVSSVPPRLQRSFTVSSSNMHVERRSAIGRRMVQRLAERRVAHPHEEDTVRRLWEEKRVQADSLDSSSSHQLHEIEPDVSTEIDRETRYNESTTHPITPDPRRSQRRDLLLVPDRTPSPGTERSNRSDGTFEYENHLRRSLSNHTSNGERTDPVFDSAAMQGSAFKEPPAKDDQRRHRSQISAAHDQSGTPLPSFSTPNRHAPHHSASSDVTIVGNQSPGGESSLSGDGLNSMMFVVGGTSNSARLDTGHDNGNWPQGVEETGGSDWGTPGKSQGQDFIHVASSQEEAQKATISDDTFDQDDIALSAELVGGRTESAMSWDEGEGLEARDVPIDSRHRQKFIEVIPGSTRTKRSPSGGSITSSPIILPASLQETVKTAVNNPSRRGSESSSSPGQVGTSQSVSHGPHTIPEVEQNLNHRRLGDSMEPSLTLSSSATTNSIQLQHQWQAVPLPVSFLPRADPNDPRIQNSKLSPFPGITALEQKSNSTQDTSPRPEKLQNLTKPLIASFVPHDAPMAESSAFNIQSTETPADLKRDTSDGASRRGWISKTFGQSSSLSSGSFIGKTLKSDHRPIDDFRESLEPSTATTPSSNSLSSPAPMNLEETSHSSRHKIVYPAGPVTPVRVEGDGVVLSARSLDVLRRMDDVLALASDEKTRPDILDDPPRNLLIATQVLQVVNVHTVKDRYLFLFNDLLVIAKPIITQGVIATLDMKFVVKSIVGLDKLIVSGTVDEPTFEIARHPAVQQFIAQFSEDPIEAVRLLVQRSSPAIDVTTLASLIFKTPELNKLQIGCLLATDETLARAFVDRFHFDQVRIDDALRMFLLAIRLPNDIAAAESLLRGFADGYFEANKNIISYDRALAADIVLSIFELNDMLYSTFGFAFPNNAISVDTFVRAFKSKDPHDLVPDELLREIYTSITWSKLVQSLAPQEEHLRKQITIIPTRLPSKLTYNVWSEKIIVSIPECDPSFKIRLLGAGLTFEPSVLDFSMSNEVSFRVQGVSLGLKSMLFDRTGANAALYDGIGNTRTFSVERAFMRHTFHISFVSHLNIKRKYCFSVSDAASRQRWSALLNQQIRKTIELKQATRWVSVYAERVRRAAEAASLQVLRDALIPLERTEIKGASSLSKRQQTMRVNRSGSVSIAYEANAAVNGNGLRSMQHTSSPPSDLPVGILDTQSGKELVLLCRQNSLLPSLLELLQAGVEQRSEDLKTMMYDRKV